MAILPPTCRSTGTNTAPATAGDAAVQANDDIGHEMQELRNKHMAGDSPLAATIPLGFSLPTLPQGFLDESGHGKLFDDISANLARLLEAASRWVKNQDNKSFEDKSETSHLEYGTTANEMHVSPIALEPERSELDTSAVA